MPDIDPPPAFDPSEPVKTEQTPESVAIQQQEEEDEEHLVALFETEAHAQAVYDQLTQSGVTSQAQMINYKQDLETEAEEVGPWHALQHLPYPDDDLHEYAEGVRRGHALLVVRTSAEQRLEVARRLEQGQPMDFEAVLRRWHSAGWIGRRGGVLTPNPDEPHHVSRLVRITAILIQRGAAIAQQNAELDHTPQVTPAPLLPEPAPISSLLPLQPYSRSRQPPPDQLPDAAPVTNECELIRQFVSEQIVEHTKDYFGDPKRIRVYRRAKRQT